MNLKTIFLF